MVAEEMGIPLSQVPVDTFASSARTKIFACQQADLPRQMAKTLQEDGVAVVRDLHPSMVDDIVSGIAGQFDLTSELEMQAAYASVLGHREAVSRYFMTVNRRANYHFIKPHCEGTHLTGMQMAAFFCQENTTDGGETVLLHANQESCSWEGLRELVPRLAPGGRELSARELALIKVDSKLDPEHIGIEEGDLVAKTIPSPIPDVSMVAVLTKLRRRTSKILNREVYSLWDSVGSPDETGTEAFHDFLVSLGILKTPPAPVAARVLDAGGDRLAWSSGVSYGDLFDGAVVEKLRPGDLIVFNNTTWCHATNNWTPESGRRRIFAAFG